jgi:outer membrane receptor protein involved in Fe transport
MALMQASLFSVAQARASDTSAEATDSAVVQEVTVTAQRLSLIGTASSASEGVVVNDELALTPAFRPGQLLETVPGLAVTSHSGEGKANQYLLRGYNLDHGTDLATFVDGMPVNEPTHAHGQGYTDLNFMIPELATNVRYTKGPYYAREGDFASVGAVHIDYLDTIEDQVTLSAGTFGFERLFSAGSMSLATGHALAALELQHYDGPWANPDDQRKLNAVLRYSEGNAHDGYSVTAMLYHDLWNATTDQPERAIAQGLIGRFGSLDPSDGGEAQRASLTGQYFHTLGDGQLTASAYLFGNHLSLWNDFTHFLIDPVNGDQEEQHEDRVTEGGAMAYDRGGELFGFGSDFAAGLQLRYDDVGVARVPTRDRLPLPASADPLGFSETDRVHLSSNALYIQATTHWTGTFRTVLGLREDYQHGSDAGTNHGTASAALFEPKLNLIYTPVDTTEIYVSAGRGFHSDDLRGVNQAKNEAQAGAPLIARQTGEEIGIRQELLEGKLAATLAVFILDAESETTYDPDIGEDTAGPASRRTGYELNITYQPIRWLEIYGSISQDRARFRAAFDDGTGHVGYYLPNAPFATASLSAYVKNLGRWSAGLEYRYLGAYPLSSDDTVQGSGYGEWNGDFHYALADKWSLGLGLYNILDVRANAAEFWYVDRLSGEPAAGVADVHVHPLEPFTARLTISKTF